MSRYIRAILATSLCALALISAPSRAVDTTYEYDALGRLKVVTRPDGTVTNYTLDPAGNRTKVDESLGGATAPATITVPSTSSTGNYTISWTAGTGSGTTYELWESMSSLFTSQSRVFTGTATSASISGHGNGTYYYRVRRCNGSACTPDKEGANGVVVAIPPAVPATVTIPASNNTGSYSITWTSVAGTTGYQLYEATNAGFSGEIGVYSGTDLNKPISGKTDGTYFYRVRACNAVACSAPREGSNSVVVTIPPGAPQSITVPGSTAGTSFTIGWLAPSSGIVTAYELYESTSSNFTSQTLAYNSNGTSTALSGRTSGTYYYRIRACNSNECSGYTSGANGILVDLIAPSAPGTPSFSITGTNVTASYGPASDNVGVTAYEYRLNGAASWSPAGSSSTGLSGLTHSTGYTFEVRARDGVGNAGPPASGSFTTGPPIPGVPSGLAFNQIADCAWSASWASTANATYYRFSDTQASESDVSVTSKTVNCPTGNPEGNKPKWVKACNATGCGGPANFGAPIDVTPPTTPGTPQFSSVTSNSATVTWTASFDFSGIANYQYNIGAGWVTIGSAPNVGLTSLNPASNYTFQVRAIDNASLTGSASSASFSTPAAPDTTPPSAPGTITMGTITSTTAPASWGAASDNVGVTGYEYRLNGAATWTNLGLVLSSNLAVTGGTNYTLEVRARDGAGNTGPAASKSFSTPAPIPAKPGSLNKWNPAPDTWYAQWGSVSGATFYRFQNNAGIETDTTSTNIQYQCPWGDCPSNRPKWVKACNGSGCSDKADFAQ